MVRLSQSADYVGVEGFHQWRCRFELDCPPHELDRIERVMYTLDRSFPQPVREVTDATGRFGLEFLTWAAFELYADVDYRDGSHELLSEPVILTLPPEDGSDVEIDGGHQPAPARYEPPVLVAHEADLVLDGGGVRCIAFAGALEAAEESGIEHWVHVAGSSGGALVAALLATGYHPREITEMLRHEDAADLFAWRLGGLPGRVARIWRNQGLLSTNRLRKWLERRFAESPLCKADPTFGDLIGTEPSTATSAQTRHRLRIIVSDLTAARMVVLPDALPDYEDADGKPLVPEEFPLVDAVLMSMSVPFWFEPAILHCDRAPHHMVDGGLLSNFPIWLYDVAYPTRPTWGVRLRARQIPGADADELPGTAIGFAKSIVTAVMGAARELEPARNATRTLTVPVSPTAIGPQLSAEEVADLHAAGHAAGRAFFASRGTYQNSLGQGLPQDAFVIPQGLSR